MTIALQQQIPSARREAQSVCFPCVLGLEEPRAQGKLSFFSVEESYSPTRGCFLLCLQGLALGRVW